MEKADVNFSVKQLAKLAGVSVRALHLYDQIGLLKPSARTRAGYRIYGEKELIRLQQILFYKELDFQLKDIALIIDDAGFDIVSALEQHKVALTIRRSRLDTLVNTIDKTIDHLKNKTMNNYDELYEGIPQNRAAVLRAEAMQKWGEDKVLKSEKALLSLSKADMESLKADQKNINAQLKFKFLAGEKPRDSEVQGHIARHYDNIRAFWGVKDSGQLSPAAYIGLADLYISDARYTLNNGIPDYCNFVPAKYFIARFIKRANCDHFDGFVLR